MNCAYTHLDKTNGRKSACCRPVFPYEKDKELNRYCYWGVSAVAILGLIYGYFYQLDYLIEY